MKPAAAVPLAEFHRLVIADDALFARLALATDPLAFANLAVELGAERGLVFTADDVRTALQAAQRAWIERNLL